MLLASRLPRPTVSDTPKLDSIRPRSLTSFDKVSKISRVSLKSSMTFKPRGKSSTPKSNELPALDQEFRARAIKNMIDEYFKEDKLERTGPAFINRSNPRSRIFRPRERKIRLL